MKFVLSKKESNDLIKYGANPQYASGPDNCFTLDDILEHVIPISFIHYNCTHNLVIEYSRRNKKWNVYYKPYLTAIIYTSHKELINALMQMYIATYELRTTDSHFSY